jgi:cbb3-type cytochrome oxidase maturation protein
METLFLLIPISLVLIGIAIWLFFRMSDSGQFDDMSGPAHAILMDDDRPAEARTPDPESGDPKAPGA